MQSRLEKLAAFKERKLLRSQQVKENKKPEENTKPKLSANVTKDKSARVEKNASKTVTSTKLFIPVKKNMQNANGERAQSRIPEVAALLPTLKERLDEALCLLESAGVLVARTYLAALPSDPGMQSIANQAIYWLTCIRIEKHAQNWSHVAELFAKAEKSVQGHAGSIAIQTAKREYEDQSRSQV